MKIINFTVTELGGYNDQVIYNEEYDLDLVYTNMYTADLEPLNNSLSNNAVNKKLCKSSVKPKIPGGWNARRLGFVLVVSDVINGINVNNHIQGYSDPYTDGDEIDDIIFYINSVSTQYVYDGNPRLKHLVRLLRSDESILPIRSSDIVSSIKISNHYGHNIDDIYYGEDVFVADKINNNNILDTILYNYKKTLDIVPPNISDSCEILTTLNNVLLDKGLYHIEFINELYLKSGKLQDGNFKMSHLKMIDPDFKKCTQTSIVGEVENNKGSNNNRMLVQNIVYKLSNILSTEFIASGLFVYENNILSKTTTHIDSYQVDSESYSNVDKYFKQIILPLIVDTGIPFNRLTISYDVYGESVVSFDDEKYIFPTFADSLYCPLIGDREYLNKVSNDVMDIIDETDIC